MFMNKACESWPYFESYVPKKIIITGRLEALVL